MSRKGVGRRGLVEGWQGRRLGCQSTLTQRASSSSGTSSSETSANC